MLAGYAPESLYDRYMREIRDEDRRLRFAEKVADKAPRFSQEAYRLWRLLMVASA